MLMFLLACGGPTELPTPHPPPEWPIENIHVKPSPVPVPAAPPAEPADAEPTEPIEPDTETPPPPPAPETNP